MLLLLEIGVAVFHILAWVTVGHALLTKREPRSALGWSAVALLVPVLGVLLYVVFGVDRPQSRAAAIMRERAALEPDYAHPVLSRETPEPIPEHIALMERLGRRLTNQHLCGGNLLTPLINGNMAYPAMLDAIDRATHHIYLVTYIFNAGRVRGKFITHLMAAARRGVDVRMLVDGIGHLYSPSLPARQLRRAGVRVAFFLPPSLLPPNLMINLRDHRKVLVCDTVAFTGGMNIADYHMVVPGAHGGVQDVHFRCEGPIVYQLRRAFLQDWGFSTGAYDPVVPMETGNGRPGTSLCRIVLDGPGSNADPLNDLIAGAISCATSTVRVMTPYFLPTREIVAALRAAAAKGVDVRVVLPAKNNLPYVHWASFRLLEPLLHAGVRVFHQPAPFAHTKLLAIDGFYCQVGSANLDSRSLRFNFELNTEVFDRDFHATIAAFIDETVARSRELTLDDLRSLSLAARLRNAACWVFSPYL